MAKEKDIKKKDVKKTNTKKKEKNNKPKEKFLVGVKKEMKLVIWPTLKEILKYTLATIIFCIILVVFFEALNLVMAYVKGLFN